MYRRAVKFLCSMEVYEIGRRKESPDAFTRNRDLPLPILLVSMINMISRTTSVELYKFFTGILKKKPVSKQAFSKARRNLNAAVFSKLLELFLDDYYESDYKTYKGYIILSSDGTGLEIPNTTEFVRDFGCPSNQNGKSSRPVATSSVLYDINNGIIINGVLKPYAYSEKEMVLEHIESIKKISRLAKKKIIILFDRGYPSMRLMAKLKENNIDFIIRSKVGYIKETESAKKYDSYDKEKVINISRYMTQGSSWFKTYAKQHEHKMSIRITTGRFSNKEIGIFITSLGRDIFSREEIVELYRRRWGIETHFRHQKETGEFENFACKTTERLKQEYHCKLYTLNLATLLTESAQEEVDEKVKSGEIQTKHELKINQNVAFGIVKDNLPRYLLGIQDYDFISELISEIAKHRIPVIKGRVFERNFHLRKRRHNIPYRRAC